MENQERRLTAMHPVLNATYDGVQWSGLGGWEVLDLAGTQFAHEASIDLSGYAMDSLTFFPTSVGLQDPGVYLVRGTADPTFSGMQVLDIITSVPMNLAELATASSRQVQGKGPGMIGTNADFSTILFGMYRFFATNTNIPYTNYVQLERSQRFDSGEATAADRLFCYRIVNLTVSGLDPESRVNIPACRQLIAGTMSAEKELVYMQRLRRSYELANQL